MATQLNVRAKTVPDPGTVEGPWYAQITHDQWRAFWAVFFGWVVDAFDFNILAFVRIESTCAIAGSLASPQDLSLLTTGPFGLSRNHLHVALIFLYSWLAILLDVCRSFVLLPGIIAIITHWVIPP